LKLRRDVKEIQVRMIAAAGADELVRAGVAAFHPAIDDTDRAAAQEGRPAMPGLAGQRKPQEDLSADAQPRVTLVTRAGRGQADAWDRSQPGPGLDAMVQAVALALHTVPARARG
jgi:hypothetical protein